MGGLSRLCDLVTDSLLPYLERKKLVPPLWTKESEKHLLLALSRVSKEIRRWRDDFESDQEAVANYLVGHNCSVHLEQPFEGGCNCLANVVSTLVVFLGIDSEFIRHLAGNNLVAVSDFLSKYENEWIKFLHLLWISLEATMSSICGLMSLSSSVASAFLIDGSLMHHSSSAEEEVFGAGDTAIDIGSFVSLFQSRIVDVNWLMLAGLFRILHDILKSLRREYGELERVYMHLAICCLLKMPWDLLSELHVRKIVLCQISSSRNETLKKRIGLSGSKDILSGTTLQLFCSLLKKNDSEDLTADLLGELGTHSKFINLVPKLLSCFSEQIGCNDSSLSQYLRHKMLMLMIRLSFHTLCQSCHLVLWLNLLKQYFEDLLYKPISECNVSFDNCLEESPFLTDIANRDRMTNSSTLHLQRQAMFLLFKCCFTLSDISNEQCGCSRGAYSFTNKLQCCSEHCSYMGLIELVEWLKRCAFIEKFMGYGKYSKSCTSFALSFLQLYMEEDDMLFDMLLLLLDAPFITSQIRSYGKEETVEEMDGNMLYHFASIFNPIRVFHLFLSLLHYDHLVLVDYLISKDTGVRCVQYLLRCLRIICEFWHIFVTFPICGNQINQPCHKRRKIFMDEENFGEKVGPLSSSQMVTRRMVEGERKHKDGRISETSILQDFENAKGCLFSLKKTVEDLYQKNLFPYNPKPLLRRFQELCNQ